MEGGDVSDVLQVNISVWISVGPTNEQIDNQESPKRNSVAEISVLGELRCVTLAIAVVVSVIMTRLW